MRNVVVNEKWNGKKVSDVLFANFDGLTKNTLYKAFRKKDIRINNQKIKEDVAVHTGEVITVYIIDDLLFEQRTIAKIFEDDNILVVDKPANLEVIGENSLTSLLEKEYSFISPCHRLDRNTTGLVLFAKNTDALTILLAKFKNHEIEKHYLAKVYGVPAKPLNTTQKLTAYLFKDKKKAMATMR